MHFFDLQNDFVIPKVADWFKNVYTLIFYTLYYKKNIYLFL